MKKDIKIFILATLYLFYKVISLFFFKKEMVVLMYHSISKAGGPLAVSPELFEKQLVHLKNHQYRFINMDELLKMKNNQSISQREVLLTFDDGYQDLLTTVLPILKKFNLPAVAFIHTDRSSVNLGNNFPLLDWEEIRELNQNGVTIGNHSHSHLDMKKLNPDEMVSEIKNSEEIFKRELGFIPKVFAYPGGKYNSQVTEFLRQHGYEAAFTIDEGVVCQGDDPLKFKRIGINGHTSMFEFRMMLTHAFNWYQFFRKLFGLKK